MLAQADADCSPAKWHLAHTSWFFDRLILRGRGLSPAPAGRWDAIFNSYYVSLGPRGRRDARGLLSRPSAAEVFAYREVVDAGMQRLWTEAAEDEALGAQITLGLNHEEQHQELLLSDILALFALNPLTPAYLPPAAPPAAPAALPPPEFLLHEGGLLEIGAEEAGFAYDCERPRHRVFQPPFGLADRLVTNAEWQAFVDDGGYRDPRWWLSDGWAAAQEHGWNGPAYWRDRDGAALEFTLAGEIARLPQAPVRHVSFYEAEAFARWAGKRLPTEAELELAGPDPAACGFETLADLAQALAAPQAGQGVWQWSASAFRPYPGFQPLAGPAGEYNGKFMANQMVLKGACLATPRGHSRRSYRNFYYPQQRWMFCGVRLAEG
jgi:ergothioneine biosynthesis protein EgtB